MCLNFLLDYDKLFLILFTTKKRYIDKE